MTENEKRLRAWLKQYGERGLLVEAPVAILDALLAEHRAEVAATRDAALEEAAMLLDETRRLAVTSADRAEAGHGRMNDAFIGEMRHAADVLETQTERIRALRSQPAQSIPVAQVRDALDHDEETARAPSYMSADEADAFENGWAAAIRCVEDRLGLPLDAEHDASAPESERCARCGHAPHWQEGNASRAPFSYCCSRSSWSSVDCACIYTPSESQQ